MYPHRFPMLLRIAACNWTPNWLPYRGAREESPGMTGSSGSLPPEPPGQVVRDWDPELVFTMLADPTRRQLLVRLAPGFPLAASQLAPSTGRRLDAVLKHLTAMRDARLIFTQEDPGDRRRQLYTISRDVTLRTTDAGQEIDFGCCVLRVSKIL
jgi:DNA-binding transcriptional ArsR family regulator